MLPRMGVEESYNFHRVDEHTTTSGVVGAVRLAELGAHGYGAVINLLPDDSSYAVEGEAELVESQGLAYVHIPVDFAEPTRADLDAFFAAMQAHHNQMVHVHCAANFRVTAFYALFAVASGSLTPEEADELIAHFWDPADHPAWAEFIREQRSRILDSD